MTDSPRGGEGLLAPIEPKEDLVVVIMAGGAGTRFWPASTEARPKQFLPLFGERSLLQRSYDRVADLVGDRRVLVLTQERFRNLVREQLPSLPDENIIGEPLRRDTAAAVALAALIAKSRFGDPVMAVLTADHLIEPTEAFRAALLSAARGAKAQPALYTFGVAPTCPATGYGYLELGPRLGADGDIPHYALSRFVEKPDEATARGYLETGRFLWNSGMFVWRTSTILAELARQLPRHMQHLQPALADAGSPGFADALKTAFEPLEKVSVDFGVMERAREVRCVKGGFSWSDVGGFVAVGEHLPKDEAGNARRGQLVALDAEDNVVFAEDAGETVALVGVSGLVVVRAGKRTLIVPKARAEEVKRLVEALPRDER